MYGVPEWVVTDTGGLGTRSVKDQPSNYNGSVWSNVTLLQNTLLKIYRTGGTEVIKMIVDIM